MHGTIKHTLMIFIKYIWTTNGPQRPKILKDDQFQQTKIAKQNKDNWRRNYMQNFNHIKQF